MTTIARNNSAQFSLSFSLSEVTEASHFVAREEELAQIHKILAASHDRRTVVVRGLGGMGKTQLAIAFAKRHHVKFSAIVWLNARDEATLKQSFVKTGERILQEHPSITYLEQAVTNQDVDEVVKVVKRWFDESSNKLWLIVYDNYDHPQLGGTFGLDNSIHDTEGESDLAGSSEQTTSLAVKPFDIRPFLPGSYHGAIIVTTRSSTVKIGQTIRLGKLKCIEDSLRILEFTSNRQCLGQGNEHEWTDN